ncbi:MAG: zinc metalloprotease HtpX [archaeon]
MIENHFKTALLLGGLTGIFLVAGYLLGSEVGLVIGLVVAVLINFGSYFFSDKIVLAMYKAKEADKKEYSKLYSMVKEIAEKAKLPMPKVFIVHSASFNAFATGRNPNNAVVAVTTGIMELLDHNELEGVIAHEISHIKNRDILIATIAATVAGVISFIGMFARFGAIFGRRDNILGLLFMGIVTPIIAVIIQMAISRTREFMADENAAKLLKDSRGLSRALEKLHQGNKTHPLKGNEAGASLFIVNPFSAKGIVNLFSTHPPIDKRIKRLQNMHF